MTKDLPPLKVNIDSTVAYLQYPESVTSLAWTTKRLIDSYQSNPISTVYAAVLEQHLLLFCHNPYDATAIESLMDQLIGTVAESQGGGGDIEWLYSLLCDVRPSIIENDICEVGVAVPFRQLDATQRATIANKVRMLDDGKMRLKQSLPNGSEEKRRSLSIWLQTYDAVRILASRVNRKGVDDVVDSALAFFMDIQDTDALYRFSAILLQYDKAEGIQTEPIRNSLNALIVELASNSEGDNSEGDTGKTATNSRPTQKDDAEDSRAAETAAKPAAKTENPERKAFDDAVANYPAGNYKLAADAFYEIATTFSDDTLRATAATWMGFCYEFEKGRSLDHYAAIAWYRMAMKGNQGYAMYRVGRMYLKGKGVQQNEAEAFVHTYYAGETGYAEGRKDIYERGVYGNGARRAELRSSWERKHPEGWEAYRIGVTPASASILNATVGRNDACPCGSGKKFKNCHGRGKC